VVRDYDDYELTEDERTKWARTAEKLRAVIARQQRRVPSIVLEEPPLTFRESSLTDEEWEQRHTLLKQQARALLEKGPNVE
jgi:hypothetical protein